MELKKDLLKQEHKTNTRIVFGVLFLIIAGFFIPIQILEKERISIFDWIYASVFFLNGISHVMIGLGFSVERIIGKAYIHIDDQLLKIKLNVFDKEQVVCWSEIELIDDQTNKYIFTRNNASSYVFNSGRLEYSTAKEVKMVIKEIAKQKGIVVVEKC